MNIFSNTLLEADPAGGSASSRAPVVANTTKQTAAEDSSGKTVTDQTATGVQPFQLLLSSVSPRGSSVKTGALLEPPLDSKKTGSTADTPATPNLDLLMSLLPALPGQAPVAAVAPAPASATEAVTAITGAAPLQNAAMAAPTAAVAPATAPSQNTSETAVTTAVAMTTAPPVLSMPLPQTAPSASPAADTSLPALLGAVALPSVKKVEDSGLTVSTNSTPDSMDRALISLDRSFQLPPASVAASATAIPAADALSALPMTHREWPTELGHHLLWNLSEGIQKAEIRVHPQDLGPIHVQIQIQDNKTTLQFTAAHPLTREALESSIPRLREMFSQQGLNLSQAQVFSQTSRDSNGRQPSASPTVFTTQTAEAASAEMLPARPQRSAWRLLDDYA